MDVTNSAQIFIFALLSPKRAAPALLRSQTSLPQSQRQVSQPCAALVLCHSRSQPSCCTTAAHSPRAMPLPLAASSQRSPSQPRLSAALRSIVQPALTQLVRAQPPMCIYTSACRPLALISTSWSFGLGKPLYLCTRYYTYYITWSFGLVTRPA